MSLPTCCIDFHITLEHLIFPERMGADGWEFVQAHGLNGMTLRDLQSRSQMMDSGEVYIQHRCAQLRDDGRCGIYATRPAICRAFDCSTRKDCDCKGQGLIPVEDLFSDA